MSTEDHFVNRAQLIYEIKKYPEIWDINVQLRKRRRVTVPMWNHIAEQLGGHIPNVKLQAIWSQMKYHYLNLVRRQLLHKEHFTTSWEHFESMSFMYNNSLAKIRGASEWLPSTPLLPQMQDHDKPSGSFTAVIDPVVALTENCVQTTPAEISEFLPSPPPLPQSRRLGERSGSFAVIANQLVVLPPVTPLTGICVETASSEISEFLPLSPPLPDSRGHGKSSGDFAAAAVLPPVPALSEINVETTPFTGFTDLVPSAAATVETTTSPPKKPIRHGLLNKRMRDRIIDAVKSRPILWLGGENEVKQGPRTSPAWKTVAVEVGLSHSSAQARWSIIKRRFVDELQKERHAHNSQEAFHSKWEHFEDMSFMRDILAKKVDEREQTREHMEEIISEKLLNNRQEQQQLQQQHQHHSQQQPQQPIYYIDSTTSDETTASILLPTNHQPTQQPQPQYHHLQHPQLSMCDENGELTIDNSHADLEALLPGHTIVTSARRRVKNENNLEWNRFELILHVQANSEAAN